jgi:hypothetical protein
MNAKLFLIGAISVLFARDATAQSPTQQVTAIQYYFNTDPGVGITGNGAIVPVTPTSNLNQAFSITVPNTLTNGLQNLYVRAKDQGNRWGIAERRTFLIQTLSSNLNVVAYQYYFDNDPGIGNAGNGGIVAVTPASNYSATVAINVSNTLTDGLHDLYVRVQDNFGRWSIIERRTFLIQTLTSNLNVVAYQYYFDNDPGVGIAGNGGIVSVTPASNYSATVAINVSNTLTDGLHDLYVRAKDNFGRWSITERRTFLIQTLTSNLNVVAYQYYFDNDPGVGIVGNGGIVSVTPASNYSATVAITVPVLSNGLHDLYVRVKDNFGRWSIIERRLFFVQPLTNTQNIVALEYYYDNDPGVGNGIPYAVTASSNINITVPPAILPLPCIPVGTHRLYMRAKDTFNRWSIIERASFTVTTGVIASTVIPAGPFAICPGGSVVLSTSASLGIALQWFKDGSPITGATSTTLTATAAGNYQAQTACNGFTALSNTVVVTQNTLPVISACTPATNVNNDAGNCGAIVNYNATTASGIPTPVITYSQNQGTSFPVGATTVTATATNTCGTATCSFIVTVTDNQVPTISCPATVNVNNDAGNCSAAIASIGTPSTNDNCGVQGTVNNHPSTTYAVGTTAVIWTVTDVHGNTNTCTQNVIVTDNEVPTISCPATVSVNNDAGNCSAVIAGIGTPVTGDNCGVQGAVNNHPSTTYAVGTTAVIWTVTDVHGNTNTCTQNVIVTDNEAPAISCPATVSVNNDAGNCSAVIVSIGTPATADNCGVQGAVNNHPSTTYPVGTTAVIWTVTDVHGNTNTCTQNIIITDNEAPTISCPATVSVNNDAGNCSAVIASIGTPVTGDNCGVQGAVNNHPSTTYSVGTTVVIWTVTDIHGNTSTCSQTVNVSDIQNPVISGCPGNINATTSQVFWTPPTASDNCPGVTMTSNHNPGDFFPPGNTTVTYTATDAHSNTASCSFVVNVCTPSSANISNNSIICLGQPATVHIVLTGTPPWSYTITDGSQNIPHTSSASPDDVNITPVIAGTHNYTIVGLISASCPGTGSGTAIVAVSSTAPGGSVSGITGAAEACTNDIKLMTAVNNVSGQNIHYSWTAGTNSSVVLFSNLSTGPFLPGPVTSNVNTIYAKFISLSQGSSGYDMGVKAFNGCGTGTSIRYTWIRGATSSPSVINGPTAVCANQTGVSYTAGTVPGGGVYTWSFPGATFTAQGSAITGVNFPANTNGQLCVTSAVTCSGGGTGIQSPPICKTISNNVPAPSLINGPAIVCPGSSTIYTYSVVNDPSAASYQWILPPGVTGSSTTNSISIVVNSLAGTPNICAKAVSPCAPAISNSSCKTIASGTPATPSNIAGPLNGVCSGNQLDYSVTNVPGTTYNWTVPSAATGVSANGSNAIHFFITGTPPFGSGSVNVTATNGPCASSIPRSIVIYGTPAQPATLTSNPNPVCANQPVSFTSAIPTGANPNNFIWSVTGAAITSTPPYSNIINVVWGGGNGTVTSSAKNVCGTGSAKILSVVPGCREENEAAVSSGSMQYSVYPNPAHDMLTLSIDAKQGAVYNVKLLDLAGRVLVSENESASAGLNQYQMDLTHLAKGVYMLTVQSAGETWKTKVVVE